MRQIRVLVVEDSLVFRELLVQNLNQDPALTVVATASDPFEARDAIIAHRPDVMTLDLELPHMNGIEFLRKLMPQYPISTVVIAKAELEEEAYEAGARQFVAFDDVGIGDYTPLSKAGIPYLLHQAIYPGIEKRSYGKLENPKGWGQNIIAMGASTGGTEALHQVIRELRRDIPGIVMVQHMPIGFTGMYAERLNQECEVAVKEAQSGDIVRQGQVLLAPGDKQMRLVKVNGVYQVECKSGPKVSGHCPSVDVLFESVAKVAGKDAIGVIMTGMGRDGAKGLLEMRQKGAVTIGQDEKTSVVYGMPKEAYEIGAVTYQVPLGQIAQKLYYILGRNRKAGNEV